MKRIVMIVGFLMLTSISFAQKGQEGRPERPSLEKMIERAQKDLTLTDEQVIQWKAIHEKYMKSSSDQEKNKETREAMDKELESTLTDDQLVKFNEIRKNRKERPQRNKD